MSGETHYPDRAPRPARRVARTWRWARWVVAPLVLFAVLYFMCTGSPIPLWHVERLADPVLVRQVTRDALVLEDGRRVPLRHVTELPADNPVFQAALKRGVEIGGDGSVYGLIKIHHWCGNDPVRYDISRVNLSELAAALNPDNIEHAEKYPDNIERLKVRQCLFQLYSRRGWWDGNQRALEDVRHLFERIERDQTTHGEEPVPDPVS